VSFHSSEVGAGLYQLKYGSCGEVENAETRINVVNLISFVYSTNLDHGPVLLCQVAAILIMIHAFFSVALFNLGPGNQQTLTLMKQEMR
jgi:hypothetical protein